MKILLFVAMACGALLPRAQDELRLRGTLRHQRELEGGVWTLTVDRATYDLHGDFRGFADGDGVEIRGVAEKHRVCFHMAGIVFRVKAIDKKERSS